MGPRGAELLVDTIRQGQFVAPTKSLRDVEAVEASQARKLTKEDAHIDWQHWTSEYILRAQKAMGALWNIWEYQSRGKNNVDRSIQTLRIQWHDLHLYEADDDVTKHAHVPGTPTVHGHAGAILTCDGKLLTPRSVTIEGRKKGWPGDSVKVVQYLVGLVDESELGRSTSGLR